jgi:hypothetical protein
MRISRLRRCQHENPVLPRCIDTLGALHPLQRGAGLHVPHLHDSLGENEVKAYVVEVEFYNREDAELFMDYVKREVPFDGAGRMVERESTMLDESLAAERKQEDAGLVRR